MKKKNENVTENIKNRLPAKKIVFVLISFLSLLGAFLFSLCAGAEKINVFKVLFTNMTEDMDFSRVILLKLRLPRCILVLLSGALLGGAGAIFQLFFRNPLAEPGIMGISSGATLGAVTAQALGFGGGIAGAGMIFISPLNFFAFGGAVISGIIVVLLASGNSRESSNITLLLCGTALGTLYSAISSIILLTGSTEMRSFYAWTMGSFNGHGWKELCFIIFPAIISVILMFLISAPLDLLSGGEKSAESLGVDVNRLRILVLVTGALAVSCSVCAGGTISFVGLIAPHIVRKIFSPKAKLLIPLSMIFGSIFLLFSDTFARLVIQPGELPAGIITSIFGVPFFISLIWNKNR